MLGMDDCVGEDVEGYPLALCIFFLITGPSYIKSEGEELFLRTL